jgi:hypothetical protein
MRRLWSRVTIAGCACVAAGALSAQEAPRTALIVGSRGPGVLVPVSNSVALRASAAGSLSSFGDSDTWTASVGLSGVFYRNTVDALKAYVSPGIGFTYSRSSPGEAVSNTPNGSVVFGAEYAVSSRFGAFGEVGLVYSRTSGTRLGQNGVAIDFTPTNVWSTTNGIGLLFRF